MIILYILLFLLIIIILYILTETIYIDLSYDEVFEWEVRILYGKIKISKIVDIKKKVKKEVKKSIHKEVKKMKQDKTSIKERFTQVKNLFQSRYIFYEILEKIRIEKFYFNTKVGVEDPFLLSEIVGFMWIGKSFLMLFLNKFKSIKDLQINIEPQYSKNEFDTSFHCIFSFRVVHIISVLFKYFKDIPKLVKRTS